MNVSFRLAGAVGLLIAFQGCAFFAGKPPLPKRASIEHGAQPSAATDYAALVGNADVIYFPRERAASGARSEPAALLLDALMQSGTPFAVGWDLIDAAQQPLLDELAGKTEQAREDMIGQLHLAGSSRVREHCRAVLRDPQLVPVHHLALGLAQPSEPLSMSFDPPIGGFEAHAERLAARGATGSRDVAQSYRAHLLRQQFAAEKIIRLFRTTGSGGKLLVFIRGEGLAAGQGVPHYVAQKIQLRQLVLDSPVAAPARSRLLTGPHRGGRSLEIVDGAPRAARD